MFVLFDFYDGMGCIKQVLKNPVLVSCECGDQHLNSLNGRMYLDQLMDCQFLIISTEQSLKITSMEGVIFQWHGIHAKFHKYTSITLKVNRGREIRTCVCVTVPTD
jgi:hypothetical protein